jgi:DNA topoisomerase-1
MKLVIVESPAKAKTIEKYLGGEYRVLSSVGHIRDIPKSASKKANAIDIEAGFVPNYENLENKKKVISELKFAAKNAEEVILAADNDREGEAIAWHVREALKLKKGQYSRITFNEITKDAVLEALKNKRDIDMDMKTAQEARRVLDRLFGYGLSGLLWTKLWYGLSAGRVQSPALRILVEREREILAFNPERYWRVSAETKDKIGHLINIKYPGDIFEEKEKEKVEKVCELQKEFEVLDIKETEISKKPNAPFTTSTLQQTANSYLAFSPSRTMRAAQKLYEKGFITYMRTDSPMLSKKATSEISFFISENFGKKYLENRVFKSKSKNAQEAHEAVRPTDISKTNLGGTDDEMRLYALIWKRTLSSQMMDARILRTKVTASNSDKIKDFSLSGSRLIFDGWLKVFPEARGEDQILPEIFAGDVLRLLKLNVEEKFTTPPNRYSEAGLVKEMEERGIGRPSTYAATIKTLKDRSYVFSEGRTLFPTDIGMSVSGFLEEHFEKYISDDFTAHMEDDLDLLSEGKEDYVKVLSDFYEKFTSEVKSKKDVERISNIGDVDEKITCPDCDKNMVWKLSRGGRFMSCARFPDCTGARTEEGKALEGPKEIGKPCPKCGEETENFKEKTQAEKERKEKWNVRKKKADEKGNEIKCFETKDIISGSLVLREGKFGKFISCSEYPKCKYVEEDEHTKKENSTGVSCNLCKEGEMTKRMGRFGEFYSCSDYPDCKNIIKTRPTGESCLMCEKLMMDGTKTIPDRCSDKTCPMHRPDRLSDSDQKKYNVKLR